MPNASTFVWGNNDPNIGHPQGSATRDGAQLTRIIIPRDFGLHGRISASPLATFTSPARAARGLLFAQTPQELERRLDAYASTQGLPAHEVRDAFFEGLEPSPERPEGLLFATQQHPRELITGVQPTRTGWRASVRRTADEFQEVLVLPSTQYRSGDPQFIVPGHSTSTDYGFNMDNHVSALDVRLSALEWALYLDQERGLPGTQNITRLSKGQLPKRFAPFFTLYENGADGQADITATDILFQHYAENKNLKDIDFSLLTDMSLLTPEAQDQFGRGLFFRPIRQQEKALNGPLSVQEKELVRAIRSAYNQMQYAFENSNELPHPTHQFTPLGYAMEFLGTPWQSMGMRYELHKSTVANTTFTLVRGEDLLPVIVRRDFGSSDVELGDARDPMPRIHPEDRRQPYEDIDPQTRRKCRTQVQHLLADTSRIRVAKPLVEALWKRLDLRAQTEAFRTVYARQGKPLPRAYEKLGLLTV